MILNSPTTKTIYLGNPQISLLLRLLPAIILLSVSRLLLYFFNETLFPGVNTSMLFKYFISGLRFDISAVFYANVLVILLLTIPFRFRQVHTFQVGVDILYCFSNGLLLVPNFVDVKYFPFTMKRMTGDIFSYLKVGTEKNIMFQFVHDFWYMFVIWILCIFVLIWLTKRIRIAVSSQVQGKAWYFGGQFILALIIASLTILGMRGGMQLKPIGILTASEYADAQNTPLILNSSFTIMRTLDQHGLEKVNYFKSEQELEKYFRVDRNYAQHDSLGNTRPMNKLNIVIVILESFSREHIGFLNKDLQNGKQTGFTPFLDSLSQYSASFNGFSDGKRSIEGIPAVLSGLPTWMNQDFITSMYSGNKINSLASLLKPEGYNSSFFHGGSNGTMGFDSFTQSAGFDKYYGRNDYDNDKDYDGEWGIWDEPYLNYFATELNRKPQPFISAIFTLSSHHPYRIPEKYKGKFRKGKLAIQEAIMYTDYALSQFFAKACKMPWYSNTLFVITADHTSEADLAVYKTRVGQYRIPILFFQPGSDLKGNSEQVMQQIDIMPSILDYLGYNKSFICFGQSIFRQEATRFDLSMISNSYQLISGNYALQWNGFDKLALYNYKDDPLLTHPIELTEKETAQTMLQFLKAIKQQYNTRMIENRLTVK
ncbi:MAG: sulfatase-like hydrolase/transferase [Bacteroidetes bacterium]|nr:sulfatase-like hydrolase/transferase [Bacteroidota bacterium]